MFDIVPCHNYTLIMSVLLMYPHKKVRGTGLKGTNKYKSVRVSMVHNSLCLCLFFFLSFSLSRSLLRTVFLQDNTLIRMAANFSSADDICEGENCEAITNVTYYLKEKKKFCDNCASKKECIGKSRKGGFNLYCEKHDSQEIKLYCKTHGEGVCQLCAMIDHHQPCMLQDIEGAIMDSRAKLNILKEKAKDKLELYRVYGDQIHQCRNDTNTHLQALKDEVDSVINEAVQTDKDKEKEDVAKINQEIDEKNHKLREEINKINENIRKNDGMRERRIELNRSYADKKRGTNLQ